MKKNIKINLDKILLFLCLSILFFCFAIKITNYFSYKKSTSGGWKKISSEPVLGSEKTGVLFDPHVILENDIFKMYVSSRENGCISYCESYNGYNWTNPQIILSNVNGTWENIINRASVLKVNNKYYMYYTGQNEKFSKIGMAESIDGINWKKYENNPIIIPEMNNEGTNVMNPFVLYDEEEEIFKMWYAAGEQFEPDVINYATSKDGVNWEKYENNPILQKSDYGFDSYKVGGCCVLKKNNKYIMYYIGYTSLLKAQILWAESEDGINWTKYNSEPIVQGSKGTFDQDSVYKPSVVFDEKTNKNYLYYNGRRGADEYIGLAIQEGIK